MLLQPLCGPTSQKDGRALRSIFKYTLKKKTPNQVRPLIKFSLVAFKTETKHIIHIIIMEI